MKTCTKCGIEKDKSEYGKRIESKDNLNSWCKDCVKYIARKYRLENAVYYEKYRRIYRYENRDLLRSKNPEYCKKYRLKNIEKCKSTAKAWRDKNKNYTQEWRSNNIEIAEYIQQKCYLKKQIGATPPPELVEVKLLINKTKALCKTLKN